MERTYQVNNRSAKLAFTDLIKNAIALLSTRHRVHSQRWTDQKGESHRQRQLLGEKIGTKGFPALARMGEWMVKLEYSVPLLLLQISEADPVIRTMI